MLSPQVSQIWLLAPRSLLQAQQGLTVTKWSIKEVKINDLSLK
jgi:hypothetical protein